MKQVGYCPFCHKYIQILEKISFEPKHQLLLHIHIHLIVRYHQAVLKFGYNNQILGSNSLLLFNYISKWIHNVRRFELSDLTTSRYGQTPVIMIVLPNAETNTEVNTINKDRTSSCRKYCFRRINLSFSGFVMISGIQRRQNNKEYNNVLIPMLSAD